jgi:hypothetical protein
MTISIIMRTKSLGMSRKTTDQDNAMDYWEEKIGKGGNVPAPEVDQHGGDIKPILYHKADGPK